jgi:hypothetical protein
LGHGQLKVESKKLKENFMSQNTQSVPEKIVQALDNVAWACHLAQLTRVEREQIDRDLEFLRKRFVSVEAKPQPAPKAQDQK